MRRGDDVYGEAMPGRARETLTAKDRHANARQGKASKGEG